MESIITQLNKQEVWEKYLAHRLTKGRYKWKEFERTDSYVAEEGYLSLANGIAQALDNNHDIDIGLPTKNLVNKIGSSKKRVVYSYDDETMQLLKLISHLLYRYDGCFAPNCYAFRRGMNAHSAIQHVNRALRRKPMWCYKLDIHDYFNSIPIPKLLPKLAEVLSDDQPLYHFFEKMLSNPNVLLDGKVIQEQHGIMAGTPTAPFLANIYLNDVDHQFHDAGIVYARYSDDILVFAPDQESLGKYKTILLQTLGDLQLEVNPSKERIFTPDEPYEFLGFKCHGRDIDIANSSIEKMKGKIRRQAHRLMRKRSRKGIDAQTAMKALINHFDRKFFESEDPEELTWSRWFFPIITKTEGMKVIDRFLQENIRYLSSGKHNKANYRVSYDMLKALGYRSLVHEYYLFKEKTSIEKTPENQETTQ